MASDPAAAGARHRATRAARGVPESGWPMLATGFGGEVERKARVRALGHFRRGFTAGLILRTGLLGGTLALLAWAVATPGLAAARLIAALLCVAAGWTLWSHVRRTNVELARFVEALGSGDLAQSFGAAGRDGGFGALAAVLDTAMRRLRDERGRLSEEARSSIALVEETPVALLTIDAGGRVRLANKTARRLFGARDGMARAAFADCGEAFVAALDPAREPTRRQMVPLLLHGLPQRAMLSTAAVARGGIGTRLVAVEPIQRELAAAEIAAQTDLVRVLTHEIMNSLTPVTSLARTAATLIGRVDDDAGRDVADAKAAVATLARRADALLGFVESYRQFARVPTVDARTFAAIGWGRELERLFGAAGHGAGVAFELAVNPLDLTIEADPELLAQALINLLKNGAEAATGHAAAPHVRLVIEPAAGGGVMIAVDDNGPGVADEVAGDIFLPFFTTKARGIGVGLSVARQIVVAHGGTIRAERAPGGGARLRIVI